MRAFRVSTGAASPFEKVQSGARRQIAASMCAFMSAARRNRADGARANGRRREAGVGLAHRGPPLQLVLTTRRPVGGVCRRPGRVSRPARVVRSRVQPHPVAPHVRRGRPRGAPDTFRAYGGIPVPGCVVMPGWTPRSWARRQKTPAVPSYSSVTDSSGRRPRPNFRG
jgi:hypothetical protein